MNMNMNHMNPGLNITHRTSLAPRLHPSKADKSDQSDKSAIVQKTGLISGNIHISCLGQKAERNQIHLVGNRQVQVGITHYNSGLTTCCKLNFPL